MKIPPTITVLKYLRSIATGDRVVSHARTAAAACDMTAGSYGSCLSMLSVAGVLLDGTRDRNRDERYYRIASDADVWMHDQTVDRTIRAARGGGVIWTPVMDERLRAAWAGPDSAEEIGRKMGRGKSSIIGRAHRLHLPLRASARPDQAHRAPRLPVAVLAPPRAAPKPPTPVVVKPLPPVAHAPPRRSVTAMVGGKGLVVGPPTVWREGCCHWPLSCGEPATRGNWCPVHGAMIGRRVAA